MGRLPHVSGLVGCGPTRLTMGSLLHLKLFEMQLSLSLKLKENETNVKTRVASLQIFFIYIALLISLMDTKAQFWLSPMKTVSASEVTVENFLDL